MRALSTAVQKIVRSEHQNICRTYCWEHQNSELRTHPHFTFIINIVIILTLRLTSHVSSPCSSCSSSSSSSRMDRPARARKASQKIVDSLSSTIPAAEFRKKQKPVGEGKRGGGSSSSAASSIPQKKATRLEYHIPERKIPTEQILLSSVALSLLDKSSQISLSSDQMSCSGTEEGGFNMVRATHGVHLGPYYWECEILPPKEENNAEKVWGKSRPVCPPECANFLTPHVRVGWSTRFGELRGPVGYDKHSYGYRDVEGSKVHQRRREDNYGEPFGVGDVVGCLIDLGANEQFSEIRFFKNGKDQGQAYGYEQGTVIPRGVFFPAISLFGKAHVRVNFGPSFIEPIDGSQFQYNAYSDVQPMSAGEIAEHEKKISQIRLRRKEKMESEEQSIQQ